MSTTTQLIDGKAAALQLRADLTEQVQKENLSPCLATVLVGDDPASRVYVRSKTKAAKAIGIEVKDHHLSADVSQQELEDLLTDLNQAADVNGILLQLPLPEHLDEEPLLAMITPEKDVDGFHAENLGLLVRNLPGLRPCTPAGCIDLVKSTGIEIAGKNAVVVGRSNIVGKPVSLLLLNESATVTVCHSKTQDLPGVVGTADILIAAVGRANFVAGNWIKPGAVVIDVGINRLEDGSLTGDVDFEGAQGRAAYITPVPGGVGPMTIAHLMQNTVIAYKSQAAKRTGTG